MVAGADSIEDMDLLWRGGMALFGGVRAPFTMGHPPPFVHLRAFPPAGQRAAAFVTNLAPHTSLLSGADQIC
jgi:hypothetical protein